MSDKGEGQGFERLEGLYNRPAEVPVEEMWQAIVAGLRRERLPALDGSGPEGGQPSGTEAPRERPAAGAQEDVGEGAAGSDPSAPGHGRVAGAEVVELEAFRARRARQAGRPLGWAVAAAAVVVMGVGVARMSVPAPADAPGLAATEPGGAPAGVTPEPGTAPGIATGPATGGTRPAGGSAPSPAMPSSALAFAARQHLGRSEALLTMVQADARAGRLDPALGASARGLLSQTRLLMDARGSGDPAVGRLFEDLELVLAQVAGVASMGGSDQARARTELELAVSGMETGQVLPRIRAALPAGSMGVEAM